MLRLFLPLYFILAAFFIGFIVAVIILPEKIALTMLDVSEADFSKGTFYMVEQALPQSGVEAQQQAIEKLQAHFGYPIKLLKQNDPIIDKAKWKRVLAGEVLFEEIDEAVYDIKKLSHSNNAIAIAFSESLSESVHNEAQGTFYLIQKQLADQPQEKWPEIINALQAHFGVPIALNQFDELNVSEKDKQGLRDGRIVDLDHDESSFDYYTVKLENSPYVLQAGPIKQPFSEFTLLTVIAFSFILSLAISIFLWIRPLWKSINELSDTADDFGQGNLAARANIKPRAMLGLFAQQFNVMAEKIDRFVSGQRDLTNAISHELRTPIARMRFGLEMLDKTDETSQQRYLQGLNTDVDDLEALVNELLHYARFEQADSLSTIEKIEVISWLDDVIENARGYAGEITLDFINSNAPTDLFSQGEPRYLARVIHNLLRNAVRYAQKTIQITLETDKKTIIIHVDDDGVGIAKQDHQRIFEPFSRLDESRNRQSGGHGLGLAIAKRIMNVHNGTIDIADSPQGGARFTLCLPRLQA